MEQNSQPRNKPRIHGQLIYDKGAESIQEGNDSLFNKWCWENWTATCKRMKFDHYHLPYTTINLKWVKRLEGRSKLIQLLKEGLGGNLLGIGLGDDFLTLTPKTKAKVNK